jgi:hypothetical protein
MAFSIGGWAKRRSSRANTPSPTSLTDEEQHPQMREFLRRHIKGEFTERAMDKPPWKDRR